MRSSAVEQGKVQVAIEYDVQCSYRILKRHVIRLAKETLTGEKKRVNG